MSQSFSIRHAAVKTSVFALSLVASAASMAAENGLQRYSAGVGGSDMTSPVVPGWYWQTAMVSYKADDKPDSAGRSVNEQFNGAVTFNAATTAFLNRLTFVSTERVLGGNLGFTAMLPIGQRKADVKFNGTKLASRSGQFTGIGDLEFGPLVHWEIGDHQAANFVPTLILPTGEYDASRVTNLGYGNFFTFRPSFQYAFIGDGWDVGGRAVLSFNTRNKATGYYSGNMFNVDWQAMKFVTEDVRVGLQGYFVRQINKDTCKAADAQDVSCGAALTVSNKTSVNAVGPAVAWLKNGGEFLLEGKFLKEFDAKNRTEGKVFWLTLSKPL
ncbi:SphA family protein [Aquabacterium sp.]|uniref:SphA family protein n=1 Tax=Aquabacterium sp. TaxID=1872578 RepID=UPI002E339895|nr:transporter [Aquabacterium sp.]HEX5310279.1 transporter [Aquabacterium sp.]